VGSSVYVCADGPSAFREEKRRLAGRERAQVVVLTEGVWVTVSFGSVVRPDPAPPAGPRRVGWLEKLRERWGCAPNPFRRSWPRTARPDCRGAREVGGGT
jgi:hypothetical protein